MSHVSRSMVIGLALATLCSTRTTSTGGYDKRDDVVAFSGGDIGPNSWRGFYQCSDPDKATVQKAYKDASSLANEAYKWVPGGRWDTAGKLYLGDDCGTDKNKDIRQRFYS